MKRDRTPREIAACLVDLIVFGSLHEENGVLRSATLVVEKAIERLPHDAQKEMIDALVAECLPRLRPCGAIDDDPPPRANSAYNSETAIFSANPPPRANSAP